MAPHHLALMVLINLIWGAAIIAGKVGLEHFPPFLFLTLRFGLALVVFAPLIRIYPGQMRHVAMIALCMGPVGFGLFFSGLSVADASVSAIATQLGVPFATLLSVAFLGEVIGWRRRLGIVLSFAGVMIISFDPAAFREIGGLMLVALAAFAGAVGTIFQRRVRGVPVFSLQGWLALVTFAAMLPLTLAFETGHVALIRSASAEAWAGVLFVTIASSFIAHAGIYYLLQRYEVMATAPLTLLAPIFTILLGVTFLGDALTWRILAGCAVTLAGVFIVALRQRQIVDAAP